MQPDSRPGDYVTLPGKPRLPIPPCGNRPSDWPEWKSWPPFADDPYFEREPEEPEGADLMLFGAVIVFLAGIAFTRSFPVAVILALAYFLYEFITGLIVERRRKP